MKTGWRMMLIYGWPFDTTQAIHRLIFSGTLEKYPSLKIVTHHLGAMLPFFDRRLEIESLDIPVKLPKPLSEYFKMIYGDTSIEGSVSALTCGYSFFGPDRIVFGTDYPFGPETGELRVRVNLNAIKSMDISEVDRTKILEGNAKKILKIN
jgi:aminocarboxymuconate-semialdehyde decarboxylase